MIIAKICCLSFNDLPSMYGFELHLGLRNISKISIQFDVETFDKINLQMLLLFLMVSGCAQSYTKLDHRTMPLKLKERSILNKHTSNANWQEEDKLSD